MIIFNTPSAAVLEEDIRRTLNEQGFQNEKKEGVLFIKKNDNSFRVYLWDTSNKHIKRLYFIYDFGDENIPKVSNEGWAVGVNKINYDNPHTTFISFPDHFSCRYETAINNTRDFMTEFHAAYQAIGNALDDYNKLYPSLERDYPNTETDNKNSIGFK